LQGLIQNQIQVLASADLTLRPTVLKTEAWCRLYEAEFSLQGEVTSYVHA
jgi:hypothetical protein